MKKAIDQRHPPLGVRRLVSYGMSRFGLTANWLCLWLNRCSSDSGVPSIWAVMASNRRSKVRPCIVCFSWGLESTSSRTELRRGRRNGGKATSGGNASATKQGVLRRSITECVRG